MILEPNNVYLGDCLELMKDIPDKSVDMILCDLPYGSTRNSWDSIVPLDKLWEEYKRLRKNNAACIFTASQPFSSLLGCSNISELKYSWIWQKNNATGHLNARKMPMKDYEDVLVFYNKPPTYNPQNLVASSQKIKKKNYSQTGSYGNFEGEYIQSHTNYPKLIQQFSYDKERGFHPTQKPIALCEYLIKTYTNEGDLILDNCAGSGSTLVAAKNLNRQYIGIEKEEKYFNICKERLK